MYSIQAVNKRGKEGMEGLMEGQKGDESIGKSSLTLNYMPITSTSILLSIILFSLQMYLLSCSPLTYLMINKQRETRNSFIIHKRKAPLVLSYFAHRIPPSLLAPPPSLSLDLSHSILSSYHPLRLSFLQ